MTLSEAAESLESCLLLKLGCSAEFRVVCSSLLVWSVDVEFVLSGSLSQSLKDPS
jgi:hypothetical protein